VSAAFFICASSDCHPARDRLDALSAATFASFAEVRAMSSDCLPLTSVCESLEPRTFFAAHPDAPSAALPRLDHVVVVVEENKSYTEILGVQQHAVGQILFTTSFDLENQDPYLRLLARHGANFIHMQAETHPSQPNYLALFSGSTQHVNGDDVPAQQFTTSSLGGQLLGAGLTFAGYSEDLPSAGSLTLKSGEYARKHNPWSDFTDVPASSNLPFSDFPNDYTKLPTVSFVVPNQENDMHTGLVRTGDRWLRDHIRSYARWAPKHNSLLVVTWDEGHGSGNQIATIITGAGVKHGLKKQFVNHYSLLRTIEDMYGLPPLGDAAGATPMASAFG
jgi:hypothetical protein